MEDRREGAVTGWSRGRQGWQEWGWEPWRHPALTSPPPPLAVVGGKQGTPEPFPSPQCPSPVKVYLLWGCWVPGTALDPGKAGAAGTLMLLRGSGSSWSLGTERDHRCPWHPSLGPSSSRSFFSWSCLGRENLSCLRSFFRCSDELDRAQSP